MKPVIFPLTTGQSGIEIYNLQQVLLLYIEKNRLNVEDKTLINQMRCCETDKQFFGSATTQLVTLFRQQFGIQTPLVPAVDQAVADRMNAGLPGLVPVKVLSGTVTYTSGKPFLYPEGYIVNLYAVSFRERLLLDTVTVTTGSFFTYDYTGPELSNGNRGVQAVAVIAGNEYSSEISYDTTKDITLDIAIDSFALPARSEFDILQQKLDTVLEGTPIDNVDVNNAKEMEFLSETTGEDQLPITLMVEAFNWYHIGNLEPLYFYGLFRQNIPSEKEMLLFQPTDVLRRALEISRTNNIIPQVSDEEISNFLSILQEEIINDMMRKPETQGPKESATYYILNYILNNPDKTTAFLKYYFGFVPSDKEPDFWAWLQTVDQFYNGFQQRLKAALSVAMLSFSIPAINNRVIDILQGHPREGDPKLPVQLDPNNPDPSLLTSFTVQDIYVIVMNAHLNDPRHFFYPDDIIGDNDKLRDQDLADRIYRNLGAAYPDRATGFQIAREGDTPFPSLKAGLSVFTTLNPSFDFRTVSIFDLKGNTQGYNFEGIENSDTFINEVGTMQRLMLLTTDYPIISALASKGLVSSLHITQKALPEFIDEFTDLTGSVKNAASLHFAATSTVTFNMARALSLVPDGLFQFDTINSDIPVVDPNNPGGPQGLQMMAAQSFSALAVPPADPYAEWRTLFGSLDNCNCTECQSIFSPSAYFVDLLQFLKSNLSAVYQELVKRRPDIIDIELTCANTNTTLPQIDIVNELLEDLVSKGYYESGAYKMYARQTIANANVQRAIPEYINTNNTNVVLQTTTGTTTVNILTPYPILKNTTYPWTQPYNFFKRQVDGHLELAGVKGYEISQRFSGQNMLDAWTDYGYVSEYLGIAKEVFQLLVNPATTVALQTAYGFKMAGSVMAPIADPKSRGTFITVSNNPIAGTYWQKVMAGRVDVLLQQTGLTYRELLELLDCYTLNPKVSPTARKMAILKNDPAVGDDTCDLSKLKVDGMDNTAIALLYRYVRLARILKWTYYDLDKAMMALNASNIDSISFAALGQIAYIQRTLNISVEDTATFWLDIQQFPYRDYSSSEPKDIPDQYTRIFRNPLLADLDATDYPFQPVPSATPIAIGIIENYLSGILQIPGSDLKLLLNNLFPAATAIIPNLGNLSIIYRAAVMLKGLQITVKDFIFYKLWIVESAYFGSPALGWPVLPAEAFDNPYDTIRFIAFAKEHRNTGVGTAQVDYLLRDKPLDATTDAAQNKAFSALLTSMRSALVKMFYAEYNDPTNDTGSALLQKILGQIMNGDQAAQLINIIQRVVPPLQSPLYNEADRSFIRDEMSFFLPGGADRQLADNTAPGYMSNITARRSFVYTCLQNYIIESQLKPYIDSSLATEFGLSPDAVRLLMANIVTVDIGGGSYRPGYDVLLSPLFVKSSEVLDRWTTINFKAQFHVLLMMDKNALLAGLFGLDVVDMKYMWQNEILTNNVYPIWPLRNTANVLPVPGTFGIMNIPYQSFLILLNWMQVRVFVGDDMALFYETLLQKFTGTISKADFLKNVIAIFKINAEDVNTLLDISMPGAPANQGVLNVSYSNDDYLYPFMYLRLIDCLEMQYLLPSTMTSLYTIAQSVRKASRLLTPATDLTQDDVNEVIQVVKAKYSDTEWLEAIRPVNDTLRVERRNALLAYLLVNPPTDYKAQWYTINDIYDTLMLDVEMTPCMPTSRIVLATNTAQLWVDRVLLGLEKYQSGPGTWSRLKLSAVQARQWQTWRNLYRVWEANRKIFIYPENWIEPELRDGKSPFFTELQKFLDQNDITDQNVEDAYRTYLERLDEVSHLQIVGVYRETEQDYRSFTYPNNDVLHVFGRTPSSPHIYYYRKRVAGEWTAWEKMDTQIDGDHFIPVMWRGRLRFYSLMISPDQEQQTGGLSLPGGADVNMPPAPSRWKVELAWTEYKNGAWSPKQMAKEPLYSNALSVETPKNIDQIFYYYDDRRNTKRWYFNNFQEEQKKHFNFFCKVDPTGELRFMIWETMTSISNGYLSHQLFAPNSPFNQAGIVPFNASDPYFYMRKQEYFDKAIRFLQNNPSFMETWGDRVGSFIVKYNGVVAYRPEFESMNPNFYSVIPQNAYEIADTRYHYTRSTSVGYAHYPENNMQLLNRAPDTDSGKMDGKYLVFPRQMPQNYVAPQRIGMPYFFYQDYNNSFFVEKTMVSITVQKVLSPVFVASPPIFISGFNMIPGVTMLSPFNGILPTISLSNVQGVSSLKYPVFTTIQVPRYRFHNFYHDKVDTFMETLYLKGIDGLMERSYISGLPDNISFAGNYQPTANVDTRYPKNNIDFDFESSFSLYNWELFFHIPLLIANKLSQNQRFAEARKWYHYVFNPIGGDNALPSRFWNFPVFYDNATSATTSSPASIMNDPNLQQNINRWANDPFKPHLVARTRVSAYMKNTVMKYLDNLIAWADNLFRTDTREAINEATLLYVLAAKLLGRPPVTIPARAKRKTKTYNTLAAAGLNAFSNALVQIESLLLPSGATTVGTVNSQLPVTTGSMFYFCFVPNDKLASCWSIVGDRLFKIRNCMNIDGIERELALFAPPIDPALLVKAAASGLSLADALADMNAPLPLYRFNVMSQKATELTQEVKALGGQLLAALEKKDAEVLALLRSGQEIKVLQAATQVRELQIDDAQTQIEGLQRQKLMTTQRRDYYQRLLNNGLNNQESMQLELMQANIPLSIAQGVMQTLSGALYAIPQITLGVFSFGATIGGLNIGSLIGAGATAMGAIAAVNSAKSAMASTRGGYLRRQEDWQQQLTLANTELTQLEKQILGAQIRKSIAEVELKNHKLQIQNAQDMDTAMHNKYTNEDLYNWMIGQISFTYFQAYKLAYDMAKRAERSYRNELSLATSDFIQFGYWDSLHKGLLSGEQLAYDIKRMEVSFLNLNKRTLELNKDISLAALNPVALMRLRSGQGCEIDLEEWLYDMDYPGQHMRRIKSVSVSIPCATGPYTTISCKLSLLSSRYRNAPNAPYAESANNFTYLYGNIQSIATSSAQNDSGMFELNFRDDRYLPFEGAGAIGKWKIDLPAAYAQFDYASIADVILHVKYTALDNGALAQDAKDNISDMVKSIDNGAEGLFSVFDPKADFSAGWQMLFPATGTGTMVLKGLKDRLPYLVQAGANIKIKEVRLYTDNSHLNVAINTTGVSAIADGAYYRYALDSMNAAITDPLSISVGITGGTLKPTDIGRAWLVLHYTVDLA